jgi:hypothetical protein
MSNRARKFKFQKARHHGYCSHCLSRIKPGEKYGYLYDEPACMACMLQDHDEKSGHYQEDSPA